MSVTVLGIKVMIMWILYVFLVVMIDTVFGLGRAIRTHSWNSSVGIDGAIRKISMLACMTFMVVLDALCGFNLIKLFPEDVMQQFLKVGLSNVGFAEFFGILLYTDFGRLKKQITLHYQIHTQESLKKCF